MHLTPFTYITDAFQFVYKHFESTLKITLIPILLTVALELAGFPTELDEGFTIFGIIATFLINIMFMTSYIQFVYSQKVHEPPMRANIFLPISWDTYKTTYLIKSITVSGAIIGFGLLCGLVTYIISFANIALLTTLGAVISIVLIIRFSLHFIVFLVPAAIGEKATLKDHWHLTKNHIVSIFLMMIYMALAFIGITVIIGILGGVFVGDSQASQILSSLVINTFGFFGSAISAYAFVSLYIALKGD